MTVSKATKGMGPQGKIFCMVPGIDNGYTAICPNCFVRHDVEKKMIGKTRNIRIEKCPKCFQ